MCVAFKRPNWILSRICGFADFDELQGERKVSGAFGTSQRKFRLGLLNGETTRKNERMKSEEWQKNMEQEVAMSKQESAREGWDREGTITKVSLHVRWWHVHFACVFVCMWKWVCICMYIRNHEIYTKCIGESLAYHSNEMKWSDMWFQADA